MKPIRGERKRKTASSRWQPDEREVEDEQVDHVLSDEGAVESLHTGRQIACQCGCLRPPAGFCLECNQPICGGCFVHCAGCNKPLGPCHYIRSRDARGEQRFECRSCHAARRRQELLSGVGRTLLGPFVEFKDDRRGS